MFAKNIHHRFEKRTTPRRSISAERPLLENLEGRELLSAVIAGAFGGVPASAIGGTRQAITFSLTNTGDSSFRGSVAVAFYAAPAGTSFDAASGALLGKVVRRGAIPPGGIRTFNVPVTISSQLATGAYQIFAVISPNNGSAQSTLVESSPLAITRANLDLAVSTGNARVPASVSLHSGSGGTIQITVTNPSGSSATIPAGESVDVAIVARPLGAANSLGDVLLSRKSLRVNVGGLAPGASRTFTVPVSFSSVPMGNFSIVAEIDTQRTLAETTFDNNQAVLAGVFTVNPPPVSITSPGTLAVGTTPTRTSVPPFGTGTTPVGSVGVTPVNTGGATITGNLGLTPVGAVGLTPTGNLGLTTTSAIGLTPTNATGLTPTSASGFGQMTITGTLGLVIV